MSDGRPPSTATQLVCGDPVFVLGPPEAVGRIVSMLLESQPSLWLAPPTSFVAELFGDRRLERCYERERDRMTPCWIADQNVGLAELLRSVGSGVNALVTRHSGGRRWIDASHSNLSMVSTLAHLYPGASFLHCPALTGLDRDTAATIRGLIAGGRLLSLDQGEVVDHPQIARARLASFLGLSREGGSHRGPTDMRLAPVCPNPIFVIGSPRSGTSALARALRLHPDLWASRESYILATIFGSGRIEHAHRALRASRSPWTEVHGVTLGELTSYLGMGINALFTSRSGSSRWVDHTPMYTALADDLALQFPGAQFIHLLRDGRRVVHSLVHFMNTFPEGRRDQLGALLPSYVGDFRGACVQWRDRVEAARDFVEANPSRCLEVRNEAMAHDPQAGFQRIFDFLGIGAHEGPARYFRTTRWNSSFRTSDGGVPEREPWRRWGPSEVASFWDLAGPTMRRIDVDQNE